MEHSDVDICSDTQGYSFFQDDIEFGEATQRWKNVDNIHVGIDEEVLMWQHDVTAMLKCGEELVLWIGLFYHT